MKMGSKQGKSKAPWPGRSCGKMATGRGRGSHGAGALILSVSEAVGTSSSGCNPEGLPHYRRPTAVSAAIPVLTQAKEAAPRAWRFLSVPGENRAKDPRRRRPFPISFPPSGQRSPPTREPLRHQRRSPPTGGLIRLRENRCREGLPPSRAGHLECPSPEEPGLVPEQWKAVPALRLSPRLHSPPRSRGTACGWC